MFPVKKKPHTEDGKYYCTTCMYPPCGESHREQASGSNTARFNADYVCGTCRDEGEKFVCQERLEEKEIKVFAFKHGRHRHRICTTCQKKVVQACLTSKNLSVRIVRTQSCSVLTSVLGRLAQDVALNDPIQTTTSSKHVENVL